MGLRITCDKCGKVIDGDFVLVHSTFYTTKDPEPIDYCSPGDEFYMCDRCYAELIKAVVDDS